LVDAKLIIGLCDRWHKTPDEIREMSADALRLLELVRRGRGEEVEDDAE
jgi:hypothetical protein